MFKMNKTSAVCECVDKKGEKKEEAKSIKRAGKQSIKINQ